MNGSLDECVIKIATNQMSLYRRETVCVCVCGAHTFSVYSFIDGHERKNKIPSKNHQFTFTAITADTARTRTRKIRADTMTDTAMTKAIVYLGLNYIFILFLCVRAWGSFSLSSLHRHRFVWKYCIIFGYDGHDETKNRLNEPGPGKMTNRRIKGFI